MTTADQTTGILHKAIHLTYCDAVKTLHVKHASITWPQLCLSFSKPAVLADRDNQRWPLFVPFKMVKLEDGAASNDYGHGPTYSRCTANVIDTNLLVLDVDNDPDQGRPLLQLDEVTDRFASFTYLVYTSYNHRNVAKHGGVDKFRILLPLKDSVTYAELTGRKDALIETFPFIDRASLAISQPFYVPTVHPDRVDTFKAWDHTAERFDLLSLPVSVKPAPSKTSSSTFVVTDALHDELPTIHLGDGRTLGADHLYDELPEGYEHRVSCYRIGGTDKKPGCFIFRKGGGLSYYDSREGKSRFIKVRKQRLVGPPPEAEEEVETTTLWTKKVVLPPKPTTVEVSDPLIIDPPPDVIHLNDRYLPSELHTCFPKRGVVAIRSPKGTGKTEVLHHFLNKGDGRNDRVLLLGHRVHLLKNLAERTGLTYYRDLEGSQMTNRMALCVNSLTRLVHDSGFKREFYHTIIIDESEQFFQNLDSPTLRSDHNEIFTKFLWLIYHCRRIILLDADMTSELSIDIIIDLFKTKFWGHVFRPGENALNMEPQYLAIINDYKIGEEQTTKVYQNQDHLLADAMQAMRDGEKVFIATNHRNFATALQALAVDIGRNSLLITSETNTQPAVVAFIENPNLCVNYDVVVTSPTLSTGVSIDAKHFTKVYGFFGINPGTFQDADQAISRVRHCADVSIWVQGHVKVANFETEEAIYNRIIMKEKKTRKLLTEESASALNKAVMLLGPPEAKDEDAMMLSVTPMAIDEAYWEELNRSMLNNSMFAPNLNAPLTRGALLWARIYTRIAHTRQQWSYQKDVQFIALRKELGYAIDYIFADKDIAAAAREIFNDYRNSGPDYAQDILDAPSLSYEEEEALRRKREHTHVERCSLEKTKLEHTLKLRGKLDIDIIRMAIRQELFQSLNNLKLLHDDGRDDLRDFDKSSRTKNKLTFTSAAHHTQRADLVKYLSTTANIDVDALLALAVNNAEIEIKVETLERVAQAFEARKKDFNYYFSARIKDATLPENYMKVWNKIYGDFLSLPLKKKKRGPRGERIMKYFINTEARDLVLTIREEKKG